MDAPRGDCAGLARGEAQLHAPSPEAPPPRAPLAIPRARDLTRRGVRARLERAEALHEQHHRFGLLRIGLGLRPLPSPIHLPNGLRALLVHDPEIYPEGPPKHVSNEDEVEEEDDDDEEEDEDEEEEEEDEDDDDDDEEEEEGNEMDGVKGGAAAAQSKKVGFLFVFFCVVHFC